ncbi:MAG: LapA family protein [Sphingopyxis sp.]|nr:LapA family protein [Sphingopyxis sp.]
MQTIKTIIWVALAVTLTIFAVANSEPVSVLIWPGYKADLALSVLILAVFLLGFLPPYLFGVGSRWHLKRKIAQQDETITMLRPATPPLQSEPTQPTAAPSPPPAAPTTPLP